MKRHGNKPKMTADSARARAICKDRHDFILPNHLKRKFYEHDSVMFAGGGISTENRIVFP
jgi:hypothetical protein